MKRISLKSIVIWLLCFVTLAAFPYLCNTIIDAVNQYSRINIPFCVDTNLYFDFAAIAISSTLTYLVIRQSSQQQTENYDVQSKMEKISARMLELELRDGIGYLRPYFSLKDAGTEGSHRQPYPYKLNQYIVLVNSGDADLFIISTKFEVNGKPYVLPSASPLFISKQSPFNEFCLQTTCLSDDLDDSQIDMTIEFSLKNLKGFQYKQILFIGFKNHERIGHLNKFNCEIQEMN